MKWLYLFFEKIAVMAEGLDLTQEWQIDQQGAQARDEGNSIQDGAGNFWYGGCVNFNPQFLPCTKSNILNTVLCKVQSSDEIYSKGMKARRHMWSGIAVHREASVISGLWARRLFKRRRNDKGKWERAPVWQLLSVVEGRAPPRSWSWGGGHASPGGPSPGNGMASPHVLYRTQ